MHKKNNRSGFILTPPPLTAPSGAAVNSTDSLQDQAGISINIQKADQSPDSATKPSILENIVMKDNIFPLPASISEETVMPKPFPSLGLPDVIGQANTDGGNSALFAPENLRISQDFIEAASVEPIIGTIPVRSPSQGWDFIRVRPGKEWQLPVAIIEDKVGREIWVVQPDLVASVADEVSFVQLRLVVNRYGVLSLWPLKISRDGRSNSWNDSAMSAAENATHRWVRVKSDQQASMYRIMAAKADFGEPAWPDMSFHEILEIAFKDRIITDYNHPLLKQLRGEL